MVVGAADKIGVAGCQIWIKMDLRFKARQVRHISHRVSMVAGFSQAKNIGIIVVCGHAPIEAAEPGDKDVFWDSLDAAVHDAVTQFPEYAVIELIDAKARMAQYGEEAGP